VIHSSQFSIAGRRARRFVDAFDTLAERQKVVVPCPGYAAAGLVLSRAGVPLARLTRQRGPPDIVGECLRMFRLVGVISEERRHPIDAFARKNLVRRFFPRFAPGELVQNIGETAAIGSGIAVRTQDWHWLIVSYDRRSHQTTRLSAAHDVVGGTRPCAGDR
jgi:hypothetical protein